MNITESDIGRSISYQCAGMPKVRHGVIVGLSRIKGYVFVRMFGSDEDELQDVCFMRWGHVKGWIE